MTLLREERVVVVAEQCSSFNDEQSFQWMSHVQQAIESIHQLVVYGILLLPPSQLPKVIHFFHIICLPPSFSLYLPPPKQSFPLSSPPFSLPSSFPSTLSSTIHISLPSTPVPLFYSILPLLPPYFRPSILPSLPYFPYLPPLSHSILSLTLPSFSLPSFPLPHLSLPPPLTPSFLSLSPFFPLPPLFPLPNLLPQLPSCHIPVQ